MTACEIESESNEMLKVNRLLMERSKKQKSCCVQKTAFVFVSFVLFIKVLVVFHTEVSAEAVTQFSL